MATVYIKFNSGYYLDFTPDAIKKIRDNLDAGKYTEHSAKFNVNGVGEDAAEGVFDLTNNPGRQEERMKVYGNGRSLSTGDIVVVDTEQWACLGIGWVKV